jgi:cell division septation protein DedD
VAARKNRGREEAGPGWASTLGGAALLLVLGFGVGLLAGAMWEEPELVMDHLAGRTTELPLVAEISADPAEVGEPETYARPLGAREDSPAASRTEVPADPPSVSAAPPPRRATPSVEDGFAIQVGAFGDQAAATQLARELRADGFPVYIRRDGERGGVRFRVRVGPVPSREAADRLASKLESDHQLPTWVLSHELR